MRVVFRDEARAATECRPYNGCDSGTLDETTVGAALRGRPSMTQNAMTETAYLDAHVVAYPVEYIAGIDLYNAGEFHAAHDAWEERWMGEVGPSEKLFLQAMIQSAVAFHHLDIGRPGAARQMYLRANRSEERRGGKAPREE